MTDDGRLRIGGWAALLAAILGPVRVVVLFLVARSADPFAVPAVVVVDVARSIAILTAAIGLHVLFRAHAPSTARTVSGLGAIGGSIGAVLGLAQLGGPGAIASTMNPWAAIAANLLVGAWLIGGGVILMRQGSGLARIGWPAELGGLGTIALAAAIAVPFAGQVGTGRSWIDWFLLLGLFAVVYLVRIWRYVVGGRLPGPGIL